MRLGMSLALGRPAGTTARVSYFADGTPIANTPGASSAPWDEVSDGAPALRSENNGYAWLITDAGVNPVVARAMRLSDGADGGILTLTGGVGADVEGLTTFTKAGVSYMVIGDIGDNAAARVTVNLFRLAEPIITGSDQATGTFETIVINYPGTDGEGGTARRDAEAMFADPATGDIYILTKRTTQVQCFRLAYQAAYVGTQTLESLGNIFQLANSNQASGSNGGRSVAACISSDGKEIFVKNYTTAYCFPRDVAGGETIYHALTNASPIVVGGYVGGGRPSSYPNCEPQGEAMWLSKDDTTLYTAGEAGNATFDSGLTSYPFFKYTRLSKAYTEVSFQDGANGYSGTLDTYLYSLAAQAAALRGTETTIVADWNADAPTDIRTALIKFDLSTLPAGCTIVGVDLTLVITTEGSIARIHKMLEAWDESTTYATLGHTPAFNDVQAASAYSAIFGDYATLTGAITIKIPVADVQAWVNGQTNNGWLITNYKADGTTDGNGFQFGSRQNATQGNKPKLTVRYTT